MKEMDKNNGKKCKGGRPAKNSMQRKSRVVSIRFSDMEYHAVRGRASKAGLSFSAYCHSAALQSKIVEAMKPEDMELLRKLSGEANNLNQLARLAHTHGMFRLSGEVQETLDMLKNVINQLSDDWKNHKRKKL